MRVQMHVDRVWHKYALQAAMRVRSVTNRALIMNENNTRLNLETHFPRRQAIRFNDSCLFSRENVS